jgi:hypothetical protein
MASVLAILGGQALRRQMRIAHLKTDSDRRQKYKRRSSVVQQNNIHYQCSDKNARIKES